MKNIRLLLHLSHSWMVHFSKLVMNLINIYMDTKCLIHFRRMEGREEER